MLVHTVGTQFCNSIYPTFAQHLGLQNHVLSCIYQTTQSHIQKTVVFVVTAMRNWSLSFQLVSGTEITWSHFVKCLFEIKSSAVKDVGSSVCVIMCEKCTVSETFLHPFVAMLAPAWCLLILYITVLKSHVTILNTQCFTVSHSSAEAFWQVNVLHKFLMYGSHCYTSPNVNP